MLKPVQDNVLLRFLPEPTVTPGGLVIPQTLQRDRRGVRRAEVLAVGPGHHERNGFGGLVPTTVKPGDVVLTTEMAGEDYALDTYQPRQNIDVEFGHAEARFRVVREAEILAVVE
jgi:co-chaperonin GroES (HSP10)